MKVALLLGVRMSFTACRISFTKLQKIKRFDATGIQCVKVFIGLVGVVLVVAIFILNHYLFIRLNSNFIVGFNNIIMNQTGIYQLFYNQIDYMCQASLSFAMPNLARSSFVYFFISLAPHEKS